jgi:hypothetical protein
MISMTADLYSEPIEVDFKREPLLEKKPGIPTSFSWRERVYLITGLIKEWHDYRLRKKMHKFYSGRRGNAPSMKPGMRGSWGVGRDYYRVQTDSGETFDIYYDRKPRGQKIKGEWVLLKKVHH